ncbi:hypothetical protein BDV96DRAFT_600933 [Lophiotrema nucula]|uniref:Aflatoxin regulatory protein domain-containing protein n=1 Tax=Lophiotrema nucula TaxID=690887 RepID=A0A6A5Z5B1_9PLEO|nr:hypothetical protein BDV96DRAFT_600933 [Lophiotrema nucula]
MPQTLVHGADRLDSDLICHYSHVGRRGKPKGSKNKKTIEKQKIKALPTHDVFMRRTNPAESPDSVEQNDSLLDGSASHELPASYPQPSTHPFSPNTLENQFLDSMLETSEMELSSRGAEVLSEAAMLEPMMLHDPSLPFAFSDCHGTSPQLSNLTEAAHAMSNLSTSSGSESSDQWLRENMLQILASPSFSNVSSPTHPPRSLIARHGHLIDPEMNVANLHNTRRRVSQDDQISCRCLQTYAELLCALRQTEAVERFGNFMRIMDGAYSTLSENLLCSRCLRDSQVTQLCSMALKNMVGALNTACTTHYSPDVRSGDYVLQQDDSTYVVVLLLCRHVSRFRSILEVFKRRLNQSNVTGNYDRQEQEYLDRVVQSIDEAMMLVLSNIRVALAREE